MPDDDKFARDHGPGWTGATRALLRDRPDDELPFDEHSPVAVEEPREERLPTRRDREIRRALEKTIKTLGQPDLRAAANDLCSVAHGLRAGTLDPDDLCTGTTVSGADALAGEAVRVLAATRRAEDLLALSPDDLAQELAVEFLRGAGRRYGIDRVAPFDLTEAVSETTLDSFDALDILSGFDMFLVGPLVREMVADLLG